jgi:hypothetical protein
MASRIGVLGWVTGVLSAVLGTLHLPGDRWPAAYGLAGRPVPDGYWAQLTYPFRSAR